MAQPKIDLANQVKGALPIGMGGTGTTTGGGSGNVGLPVQTGQGGKFLFTDGVSASWMALLFDLDGGVFDPPVSFGSFYNFDGGVY